MKSILWNLAIAHPDRIILGDLTPPDATCGECRGNYYHRQRNMKIWLSIDPGFKTAGAAAWQHRTAPIPIAVESFKTTLAKGWHDGSTRLRREIDSWVRNIIGATRVDLVVIEKPSPMIATARGAAALDDAMGVAYSAGVFTSLGKAAVLIPVREWKGNMPKDVTARRIRSVYDNDQFLEGKASHALDAVGIGLHYMGFEI